MCEYCQVPVSHSHSQNIIKHKDQRAAGHRRNVCVPQNSYVRSDSQW